MAQWQEGDVETNGIRLHYTQTGGDLPPLVLAHGVTDSGLCWTPVAEALAHTYNVIMLDARGHGHSAAPATGYDPATQAADVAGAIAALGLPKPIVLGHSMGAVTALVLAGMFPDVPGAIFLEDPPGWWVSAPTPAPDDGAAITSAAIYGRKPDENDVLNGMRAWFIGLKHKTRAELIAEQYAAAPVWSEAELGPWADAKLQVSDNVLAVFDPATPHTVRWSTILRRITCAALLITADGDRGAALDAAGAAALKHAVPQLQIAHISGAGHNIRREQFGPYMQTVSAFLAALTEAPPRRI